MLFVIETHGPSAEAATEEVFGAACLAQKRGKGATVLLIQEGVMHAVQGPAAQIGVLLEAGVPVLIDRFSLALRGIDEGRLPRATRIVDMPAVVNLFCRDGTQPLWH